MFPRSPLLSLAFPSLLSLSLPLPCVDVLKKDRASRSLLRQVFILALDLTFFSTDLIFRKLAFRSDETLIFEVPRLSFLGPNRLRKTESPRHFSIFSRRGAQDAPKTLPRRPKTLPRAPKTPPRRAKMPPKTPQKASRASQDAPRCSQDGPKTSQETFKACQDAKMP